MKKSGLVVCFNIAAERRDAGSAAEQQNPDRRVFYKSISHLIQIKMKVATAKTLFISASLLLMIIGVPGCSSSSSKTEADTSSVAAAADTTFTNPLLKSGPDPWAIYHEGNYYYIKSEAGRLVLMKTPDITDLQNAEQQVIWEPPEGKIYSQNIWAPEIHNINDDWYIYVAADDGDNRNHRMFALENSAQNPFEESFEMKSQIKTDPNDNWAIDGSVFEHEDELYFIWSGWEKPKVDTETQNIYIAKMSNPWTISSDRMLLSTPEYEWERNWKYEATFVPDAPVYVNEGPQMLKQGDKLHIIYSASGCWTPDYALGRLSTKAGSNLLNPDAWEKSPDPVFKKSEENGVYGTGHNSFFQSPDDTEDWILYHANDTPDGGCGNSRSPRAQKISWTEDDMPILGKPVSTSTELVKPSGTL
jgi:GH43 family beta-xylosidase